jgi:hypothetical protein
MYEKTLQWTTQKKGNSGKTSSWYWTVSIVAGGLAIASFIMGNILLGLLAIVGAFAIMLAGSTPVSEQKCSLSDAGVHIDNALIPYVNITQFAIQEDIEPKKVVLQTKGLMGIITLELEGVDFRAVRSELKNHNVDEVEELHSFGERLAEMIGM